MSKIKKLLVIPSLRPNKKWVTKLVPTQKDKKLLLICLKSFSKLEKAEKLQVSVIDETTALNLLE